MTASALRSDTVLDRVLTESRAISVEFGHTLANQLPMRLVILHRLAHAHLTDSPDEIATALAYWATMFLPLAPTTGAQPVIADPANIPIWLAGRREMLDVTPKLDLLWHVMRDVGRHVSFAPVPVPVAVAVAANDEHDISLVSSAMQDKAAYGDRAYRRVAARRVGLLAA